MTSPDRDFHASIQFVYYVQYQLHRQLLTVSRYAAEHQVVLKGDLPIGELSTCAPWGSSAGSHATHPASLHKWLRMSTQAFQVIIFLHIQYICYTVQVWTSAAWTHGCIPRSSE